MKIKRPPEQPALFAKHVLRSRNHLHEPYAHRLEDEVSRCRATMRGVSQANLDDGLDAARWFVGCLYQAFCCIPEATLALPRAAGAYTRNDPTRITLGYRVVTRVLEAAKSLGWVVIQPGYVDLNDGDGRLTRVCAAGELREHFLRLGVRWQRLESPSQASLIEVREAATPAQAPEDLPGGQQVSLWRENVRRINELLLERCIYLDCPDAELLGIGMASTSAGSITSNRTSRMQARPAFSFSRVALRRIFSRGRLDRGGRFYGGWWQYIPKGYRRHITIDESLTVECDFAGMATRCLYALEGLDIGASDPYDIGIAFNDDEDPRRKIVKRYLNAILNDEKGNFRLEPQEYVALGLRPRELRERVWARHSRVSKYFGTGVGLRLQFTDSQIAQQVMLHFAARGEVCLPVHDSFIVRAGLQDELQEVMREEFRKITGVSTRMTADTSQRGERMWRLPERPVRDLTDLTELIRNHLAGFSISHSYRASWEETQRELNEPSWHVSRILRRFTIEAARGWMNEQG